MRGEVPVPPPLLDVVLEKMALPGGAAAVARPRDWPALREAEAELGRDTPYWAVPWASGIALARALAGEELAGKRVLELGTGLGLGAIGAARAGASVLALDGAPEAVVFAAHNLALNELEGETALAAFSDAPRERWDLVIAADVLYQRDNVGALLKVLPGLLGEEGELWLADPGRAGAGEFLAAAKKVWRLRSQPDTEGAELMLHVLGPRIPR